MYGVLGIRTLGAAEWNAAQHSCTYQRHESAQSEFDVATIINIISEKVEVPLQNWPGLFLFSCRYGYVLGVILSNERKLFG